MSEKWYSAAELAMELGLKTARKVNREAVALGLGINLGGRAGYRYSEEDRRRLIAALRNEAPVAKRRRRSA